MARRDAEASAPETSETSEPPGAAATPEPGVPHGPPGPSAGADVLDDDPPHGPAHATAGGFNRHRDSLVAQRSAEEQARFATRFAGQLLAIGATLSMILTATLGLTRNKAVFSAAGVTTYGACLVGIAGGVALIVRRRPAPQPLLVAIPSLAAVLITIAMAVDRSSALSGMVLLTWPVLFAGYLLPTRAAWWTLGVVLACLGIVVLAGRGPDEVANWIELATSVTLTLIVILRLRGQTDRLKEQLAEQARTDDLTGLANRRAFTEALDREYTRYRRYRRPLSLLAVDVDHFKLVNDTWGHSAGDTALRELGKLLATRVRSSDSVGRVGGEEFCVIMPDCGADQAFRRADSLRAVIREAARTWPHPITVSIGVATIPDTAATPEQLHDAADAALYEAKAAGRDRVRVAAPADVHSPQS